MLYLPLVIVFGDEIKNNFVFVLKPFGGLLGSFYVLSEFFLKLYSSAIFLEKVVQISKL